MPIGLSAIGAALLTLAGLLGVRMRRRVQPAAHLAMAHGADMSIPMAQASVDNILELKAQQSLGSVHRKDDFMSGGWGQPSSQNLRPLTALYALFDPIDFSEKASAQSPHREAELKHGRVAMLAASSSPIARPQKALDALKTSRRGLLPLASWLVAAPAYAATSEELKAMMG